MLFDVTPSKEITGGPWYTEQEFDHQLNQFHLEFLKDHHPLASLIKNYIFFRIHP